MVMIERGRKNGSWGDGILAWSCCYLSEGLFDGRHVSNEGQKNPGVIFLCRSGTRTRNCFGH